MKRSFILLHEWEVCVLLKMYPLAWKPHFVIKTPPKGKVSTYVGKRLHFVDWQTARVEIEGEWTVLQTEIDPRLRKLDIH